MADLDTILDQIKSHELFLRLKDVIENHEGWHDTEDVFSHCVKTSNIAKEKVNGDFIENDEVRRLFQGWMNEEVYGMKRRDIAVIGALLHDSGKLSFFREGDTQKNMILDDPDDSTHTLFAGHEYLGGTIVAKKILEDLNFDESLKNYICNIIRLHGDLNSENYYLSKKHWSTESLISHVKSQAEGFYMEDLFNAYCDCYTAPAFEEAKKRVEEIFNTPDFYTKREYFIPESE